MSGRYEAANSKAGVNTANTVMWQLRNTGTAERLEIVEIGISISTAPTTAPSFYLARASAVGTITTTMVGQPHDTAETTAQGSLDSVFSAAPTINTALPLRQLGLPVTAGSGLIWTFYDKPLIVPINLGLCIVNANASGATLGVMAAYAAWDE
jgi:hypothetical protein